MKKFFILFFILFLSLGFSSCATKVKFKKSKKEVREINSGFDYRVSFSF